MGIKPKLMKFNKNFNTSLFVYLAISIILISLMSVPTAAKTIRSKYRSSTTNARTTSKNTALQLFDQPPEIYPVCKKEGVFKPYGPIFGNFVKKVTGKDMEKPHQIQWSGKTVGEWIEGLVKESEEKIAQDKIKRKVKEFILEKFVGKPMSSLATFIGDTGSFLRQGFNQIILVLAKLMKMQEKRIPSFMMGDFTPKQMSMAEFGASDRMGCAKIPLAKNDDETMSVVGLHAWIPAGCATTWVNAGICLMGNNCGTFGISVTGGLIGCLTSLATAGAGMPVGDILRAFVHLQAGYSKMGEWEIEMTFMNIKTKDEIAKIEEMNNAHKGVSEKKYEFIQAEKVKLRGHIYLGVDYMLPELGSIGGLSIAKYINITISGRVLLDFGPKNPWDPKNIESIFNDKALSNQQKLGKFITEQATPVKEFSIQAKGVCKVKMEILTQGLFPDFKILEDSEMNILTSLSSGENRGASGANPGFHLYFKPPVIAADIHNGVKFLANFIERKLNFLKRVYLLADLDPNDMPETPKLPELEENQKVKLNPNLPDMSGTEVGFHIFDGEMRFKIDIKKKNVTTFSLLCYFGTEKGQAKKNYFKYGCEMNKDYIQIIRDGVNHSFTVTKNKFIDAFNKGKEAVNKAVNETVSNVKEAATKVK